MYRNNILGATDSSLLSPERQYKLGIGNTVHPLPLEEQKRIAKNIRHILPGGNLSDLANKHNMPIQTVIILSNLCNSYKQLDTELTKIDKLRLGAYRSDYINLIVQTYSFTSIGDVFGYIEKNPCIMMFKRDYVEFILQFPRAIEFHEIKSVLEPIPYSYINTAFIMMIYHTEIIDEDKKDLLREIINENTQHLDIILRICNSFDDTISVFKNSKSIEFIKGVAPCNIDLLVSLCENIDDFNNTLDNPLLSRGIENISTSAIHIVNEKCSTLDDFRKICCNRYLSYGLSTCQESSVLGDMLEHQIGSSIKDANCELEYLKDKAVDFLDTQDGAYKNILGFSGKMELNIYVRYGGHVDFPEIAEALIIFTQQYIRLGFSELFGSINIIPRIVEYNPSEELYEDEDTTFVEVTGSKAFKECMSKQGSACIYLSHSSQSHTPGAPSIVSHGMAHYDIEPAINSQIELEEEHDRSGFTKTSSLEYIFHEFMGNLQDLEQEIKEMQKSTGIRGLFKGISAFT